MFKKLITTNSKLGFFLIYGLYKPLELFFVWQKIKINSLKKANKNKIVAQFKDIHKGEACIIVGNGPSAKLQDFDIIADSNIVSFGANRIIDVFQKTKWRPTYMSVMDISFLVAKNKTTTTEEYLKNLKKYGIKKLFATQKIKPYIEKGYDFLENVVLLDCAYAPIYSKKVKPYSADIATYISDLGNVTPFAIQIAAYMGFKKIYLYGMDNTYTKYLNNDGKYVIDKNQANYIAGIALKDQEQREGKVAKNRFEAFNELYADKRKNDIGYKKCREFAEANGIEIINLTHGGKLDEFKRQNFYHVFPQE